MLGVSLADERHPSEEHCLAVWDVDPSALVDVLAAMVRDLYIAEETLRRSLTAALEGLDGIADAAAVQTYINETATATIPEPNTRAAQPWLDMARNEVGEVLAYYFATTHFGASVVSRVKNKETGRLPTRGMDLLGVARDGEVYLLAGEVKSSSSSSSPPNVVGGAGDSLRGQLVSLLNDRDKIVSELTWSLKHASEQQRADIARALILFARDSLRIKLFPVLVRPQVVFRNSDFGCFETEHSAFLPNHIRFTLLRLPDTIEAFAQSIYEKARVG